MNTVCEKNQCAGCMACVDSCPRDAISIIDNLTSYNAVKNPDKCVECGICTKICQNNSFLKGQKPSSWYQGWALDENIRRNGSSGGAATALGTAFIKQGGAVCSCSFVDGEFRFDIATRVEDVKKFSGSKYVKSNPGNMYRVIKQMLQNQKVLFIGLPCQVAAMKNFVGENLQNNLYTVDLICHGTPSPKTLEIFLNQHGCKLKDIENIKFRVKGNFQVRDGYKGVITTGVCDSYLMSFLNGICYTDNCYNCNYARFERISDITLGDSWGSLLSSEELRKGVSLILCQTQKGRELIQNADVKLVDVDIKIAVENNHQLKYPSVKPSGRDTFFDNICRGKTTVG